MVLVRQGDTARGVEAFRQAVRFDPTHPEAHRNLGVALDRQGDVAEAAGHYRAFLRHGSDRHPARADVLRRLAEIAASKPTGVREGASASATR